MEELGELIFVLIEFCVRYDTITRFRYPSTMIKTTSFVRNDYNYMFLRAIIIILKITRAMSQESLTIR